MRDRAAPAPIVTSAPPAKADIDPRLSHVGFGPILLKNLLVETVKAD